MEKHLGRQQMQQNRLANGREDEKNEQWPEEITAGRERVEEISTNDDWTKDAKWTTGLEALKVTRQRTIKHVFHQTKEGVTFFMVFNVGLKVYSLKKNSKRMDIQFFVVVQDSHSKYKIENTLPNFENTKELQNLYLMQVQGPKRCQYQSADKKRTVY